MYHCFFEQSGTFKREFIKLGYEAKDYDILNDFGETDYIIDLFDEINKAYLGEKSIFDSINPDKDEIIAFFPCVRFEDQIILGFRGEQYGADKWSIEKKLERDLQLHKELHDLYSIITKFALVCFYKKIKCIIENPYSVQHYLTRYWALKPSLIDKDRSETGDYYKKPTQFFFINKTPANNFIFEPIHIKRKKIVMQQSTVERSMISPDYANRFIREFILKDYVERFD